MTPEKQTRLQPLVIDAQASLLDGLRQMDQLDRKLLIVMQDDGYRGLLSAGDIQRAIIANVSLESPVLGILRDQIRVASVKDDIESIKALMVQFRTEFMPVLNGSNHLVDVIFWEDLFAEQGMVRNKIDLPVIVMAGGKGTRLKPFSNILPKPLFPLGDKTIIEVIMDRFRDAGCNRFYLSVNHKADFIRSYLDQLEDSPYALQYIQEDEPLGTAGSLHLIEQHIDETFFVTNCDIVIDTDYSEVINYHRESRNEITLVAALKHIKIPYGTVSSGQNGALEEFKEKPELNYLINAGLYVLEPHLIKEVPKNTFFHITDLIEKVRQRGGTVGVYPVSEKSWCDIGEWHEYRKTLDHLGLSGR